MKKPSKNLQDVTAERRYPSRPFVGVGAVIWKGEEFLMVRQERHRIKTMWTLPGGLQELGESVREAVVREVKEETQLDVEVCELLDVVDGVFKDEDGDVEFHYTLIDFDCRHRSGRAVAGSDVDELKWVHVHELPDIDTWDETRRIIELSVERQKEKKK